MFDDVLNALLDATGKGMAVAEVLWVRDGREICIEAVKPRPQQLFTEEGGAGARDLEDGLNDVDRLVDASVKEAAQSIYAPMLNRIIDQAAEAEKTVPTPIGGGRDAVLRVPTFPELAEFLSELLAAADILGRAQVQAEQRQALGREFPLNREAAFADGELQNAECGVCSADWEPEAPARDSAIEECRLRISDLGILQSTIRIPQFEEFFPEGAVPEQAAAYLQKKLAVTKTAYLKLLKQNNELYQDSAFFIAHTESIPLIEAAQQGIVKARRAALSEPPRH